MAAPRKYSTRAILRALTSARSVNHAAQLIGMSTGALRKRCVYGADSYELSAAFNIAVTRGRMMCSPLFRGVDRAGSVPYSKSIARKPTEAAVRKANGLPPRRPGAEREGKP